jgi:transglutaminase-like putative cysteine protease
VTARDVETPGRRLLAALPLLVSASALGAAANWPLALALVLVMLLAALVGPRWEVDTGRQLLSSVIGAAIGYVLTSFMYEAERGQLSDGWAKLSAAALAAGAARSLLVAPRGGQSATLALAFAGLTFAGKTHSAAYTPLVVVFLASGLWSIGGGSLRLAPRRVGVGAAVLALAAGLAVGGNLGLLRLHAWAQGRLRHSTHTWRPRTGFSDRMDLGALEGLLDSERRMLRVRGAHVDYLRGAVLDVYQAGGWRRSETGEQESLMRLDAEPGPGATEISAVAGRLDRFFLPLEARALSTRPLNVLGDAFGALRPDAKQPVESVRFVVGARDRAGTTEPRRDDLKVPQRLAHRLSPLAIEWTLGATSPADKLHALMTRLETGFEYSREFSRLDSDPVLDFLFVNRRGHCEYFASALALMARSVGIPARVVMGYRVTERSPFGYFVVRERNAHAWVEAWLPERGWTTQDATPAEAQPQNRAHEASYFTSSVDALAVAYDDATDWLARRSLLETSLAWVAGCVVLALIIARGVRRQARVTAARGEDEALLPFMQSLLATLERQGHARRPDEPLERLAARLPDAEIAGLLARYSAHRYGGIGDRDALARDVTASVETLRRQSDLRRHSESRRQGEKQPP